MTQNHADLGRRPKSRRNDVSQSESDLQKISGDPGVGGLLADPEEAVLKPEHGKNIANGPPSPDPEQPRAHGDWAPNRAWRGRSADKH